MNLITNLNEAQKSEQLEKIFSLLLRHQELRPDDLYNFACYHSLKVEFTDAKNKLQHYKDKQTLPENPKINLLKDTDLQPLREAEPEWFAEFVDSLPEG